jgi:GT2 family glycosyltransferase
MIRPAAPELDVVVVAFGAPDLLASCLERLEKRFPVVVVDNSSDSSVQAVVERNGATYVDPGRNLGFAAGVNLGLSSRKHDNDVLLLNPDATIDPEDALRLLDRLHHSDDLACVAPLQVDQNGEAARIGWPFPTPFGAWMEAIGLGFLRRRIDFLIGSVLLVRAAALEQVGLFDTEFFLYAEETDWQRRASELGWRVELCQDAVAVHVGAGTGGDRSKRETHFHASIERYVRKHHGAIGWWIFRCGAMTGALVRALVLPGDRGREAAARFRLYRSGPIRSESVRALTGG